MKMKRRGANNLSIINKISKNTGRKISLKTKAENMAITGNKGNKGIKAGSISIF